jgi:hypothetical protein
MSERCNNCGAELYAGQQFCRKCGAAVGRASEDAPTQMFPQGGSNSGPINSGPVNSGPVNSGPFAGTSPLGGGARTESVGPRPAVGYQPPPSNHGPVPPSSFQPTSPLVGQPFNSQPLSVQAPARTGRRWPWLVALLAVFLLCVGAAGGVGYVIWRAKQVARRVATSGPDIPSVPVPPNLGDKIRKAIKEAGAPMPLDESGATVTGTDTVITKTYTLDDDATFSLRGTGGNVSITGTDGDRAEVKITKHGGSPQERSSVPVLLSQTDEQLAIVSAPAASGVEVSYEVKLPRGLSKIEISADHGDMKVADFGGAVAVKLREGHLEFRDLTGEVSSGIVNGSTKITFDKVDREGDQKFSVVNGDIEATVADGTDADLKAESVNGDISVDERYGLKAEKRAVGHVASGRLGDGGPALELKTVNGGIKLKKP